MMPAVPNGAPRFVESSHGQDAGWLGPLHHPLRIDADASLPDYRVGEFTLRADVPLTRSEDRRRLLRAFAAPLLRHGAAVSLRRRDAHTPERRVRPRHLLHPPVAVPPVGSRAAPDPVAHASLEGIEGELRLQNRR
jgi:hypothetical protein